MKADWIRIIHVAKNKTGIDDEGYRGILSGIGVSSSKELSSLEQFDYVMAAFKNLGFTYSPRLSKSPGRKRAATVPDVEGFITQKQEYYIKGLWQLCSRIKDDKSLKAMIKRIGRVDDIRMLRREKASAVILAMRDICWKAGLDPDSWRGN
jgi:hypothetical protein